MLLHYLDGACTMASTLLRGFFYFFFFFAQRDCSGIPIGDLQASGPWIIVAFQPFIDAM